jgi:hypothetical protein
VTVYDAFGADLRIGDTIVYPVRAGSQMWIKQAKILCFGEKKGKTFIKAEVFETATTIVHASYPYRVNVHTPTGMIVTIKRIERVVRYDA